MQRLADGLAAEGLVEFVDNQRICAPSWFA
jgi:hypothetical protein